MIKSCFSQTTVALSGLSSRRSAYASGSINVLTLALTLTSSFGQVRTRISLLEASTLEPTLYRAWTVASA